MTPFRISFTVPGPCVPKQRARVTSQGTLRSAQGHAYYAPRPRGSKRLSYLEYRELVQVQAREAMVNGSWRITPDFQGLWGISIKARLGAGDADNVLGSFLDALQGILWENDKQVLQASVTLERVGAKAPRGVEVECFILP